MPVGGTKAAIRRLRVVVIFVNQNLAPVELTQGMPLSNPYSKKSTIVSRCWRDMLTDIKAVELRW